MRLRLIFLAMAMLLCGSALSQTMYKCGRVYQDRPCADGKGKSMGAATSEASAAAPASGPYAAECAQRGKDSLKIVWAREGGATEERMLGEASTSAQKRLVQDVYRKRGAASQIQVAIEADCLAEKAKLEQDAALAAAAAVRAQREGALPAPSPQQGAPAPVADPEAQVRMQRQLAEQDAERKRSMCAGYNSRSESLRARERAGGNAAAMERLANERRDLSSEMSRNGCS